MDLVQLINRFSYAMTLGELKLMHRESGYPNLSYNSYLYLCLVDDRPGITVGQLSELLQVTKPAVTIKINELVNKGYVVKRQSASDKRVWNLYVSESVEAVFGVYDVISGRVEERMKEHYSDAQIEEFCEMVDTISKYYLEAFEHE